MEIISRQDFLAKCEKGEIRLTHICNFHKRLDIKSVEPIRNTSRNKPNGGFWLSINESWESWCSWEMPKWLVGNRFEARLKPEARVLLIWDNEDLKRVPNNPVAVEAYSRLFQEPFIPENEFEKYMDFEALAKEYDAVAVMIQSSDDRSLYDRLYGWDCDSMLILNPSIIEGFEKTEPANPDMYE